MRRLTGRSLWYDRAVPAEPVDPVVFVVLIAQAVPATRRLRQYRSPETNLPHLAVLEVRVEVVGRECV